VKKPRGQETPVSDTPSWGRRSRLRWIGFVAAAAVLAVAVLSGLVITANQTARRTSIAERFDGRQTNAARFVEAYVAQVMAQERRLAAAEFTGDVTAARFNEVVGFSQFKAAVLLDDEGRLLRVAPTNPALIGTQVGARYTHLRSALAGTAAVSDVVPSASKQEPVIGFAVPFETPTGRRVFSGAYSIANTPLQPFIASALSSYRTANVYLLDSAGTVISADQPQFLGLPLQRVTAELASRLGQHRAGFFGEGPQRQHYTSGRITGTPWTLVFTLDSDELMSNYTPLQRRSPWAALAAFLALGLAMVALLMRALDRGAQARDEHASQRAILDTSADAYVGMDAAGLVSDWNIAASRLLGWTRLEALGQPVATLMIPSGYRDTHTAALDRFLTTGLELLPRHAITVTAQHRDGHEIPVELTVSRSQWQGTWRFHAFVRDITERLEHEQQLQISADELRQARDKAVAATHAKSAFLATMSHEIRTPMNAVIGLTGLLLDTDLDAEQREFTETVRNSGENLLSIINDILDFSKIESGQLDLEAHPFDVRESVESAVSLLALPAGKKGLELITRLKAGCPDLAIGDVTRFRQVIVNLLANAVKFTTEGEVLVTVDGARVDGPPDSGPDAGLIWLRVSVRDTGIGIPADRIDRLFQSFSQVDSSTTRVYGGTGLGLVISKRLAQVMGGDLQVTSAVGVGSTFTFTAVLQACPQRRAEPVDASLRTLAGKSVLLVGDHATQRDALSDLLQGWGMTCSAIGTSAESLGGLALGPGQKAGFDVVLLDLPGPTLDDDHLTQVLRALPVSADLPVILLSSLQRRPRPEHAARFAAVLTKPVRSALLRSKLLATLAPTEMLLSSIETRGGQRATDSPAGGRPLRILVAEDNEVNQLVVRLILTKLGHDVDTVSDGLEAVLALRSTPYDAVLMDMQMPGLDGPAATRQIRQQLSASAQPFIVAVTASVLSEDRQACLDAGMDAFLTKPIRPEDLESVLASAYPPATSPVQR